MPLQVFIKKFQPYFGKACARVFPALILLAVSGLLLYRLGTSMFNADQHFWFSRTQGFTKAILQASWGDTYQNPKPGVTVMWMSGFSLETFLRLYEFKYHFRPQIYTYDTYPYIDIAVKLPLVLTAFLSLLLFYKWGEKLFGRNIALLALILLGLQPYYIGISRYFHSDGTLSAFMMCSVIGLFMFIKFTNRGYLILSGIFAGLAFLTKMQAVYLFAYIPFILLLDTLFRHSGIKKRIRRFVGSLLFWSVTAVATVYIFFPAMWVAPADTLKSMFTEARIVKEQGRNGGEGSNIVYTKAVPKIFSSLVLVTFVVGLTFLFQERKHLIKNKLYFYSLLFILLYFCQMAMVFQKSERYLLPLFPFVSLIGAYGFERFVSRIWPAYLSHVTFGLFCVMTSIAVTYAPHYTAIAEEAPWGSLYVEAAKYLNAKPRARELHVVAVPKEHTFRPFFMGKTYGKGETLPDSRTPDYVVAANFSYLPDKYSYCVKEQQIVFKRKVFWEIYKCD